jgi:hypothetical protein
LTLGRAAGSGRIDTGVLRHIQAKKSRNIGIA